MRLTGMTLRMYALRVAGAFGSGALVGMALMGLYLSGTVARQNRAMGLALDQVKIAHRLSGKCEAALKTVWAKIDAGRAEEARRQGAK